MILFVELAHTVDDLSLLEGPMSHRRKHGLPILESVFFHHGLLVPGRQYIRRIQGFRLTVSLNQLPSLDDIILFQLIFKPLVDLIFGLRALYHVQPVTARSLGVLGSHDLHPVAVFDLVINCHQLTVDSCPDHPVAHRAVHIIGKINGCRACRQALYVTRRGKAEYRVGKKV